MRATLLPAWLARSHHQVRFGSLSLSQFEEVAAQLGQLGCAPDAKWLDAFER